MRRFDLFSNTVLFVTDFKSIVPVMGSAVKDLVA